MFLLECDGKSEMRVFLLFLLLLLLLLLLWVCHARTSSSSPTACTRMYVLALAVLLGLVA